MSLTAKVTRILVPTDFSLPSEVACHLAARLANYVKAEVVVFHALPGIDLLEGTGRAREKMQVDVLNDVRTQLEDWVHTVVPAELRQFLPVQLKVKVGEAVPGIAWAAKQSRADLILMATHGRTGLAQLLMGSVTEAVLRHVAVPVLALRVGQGDHPLTEVQRILWATDLSPVSERAWRYALTLADVFAAEVVLLHVVRPAYLAGAADHLVPPASGWMERYLAPLESELERRRQAVEALGLRARRKVVVGVPADVIVAEAEAEQADLVVVGTQGRTGLSHLLLGSVAEAVIRKAPCPVLAVQVKREGEAKERDADGASAQAGTAGGS
ncbi:MAG: universal stress protein [candidate division NC10 bacterium]